MLRLALIALPICFAAAAAAQPPDWSRAERIDVTMSNFEYSPRNIHLRAGQPVTLHIVNAASGGHDFTARKFFSSAIVRQQDANLVEGGAIELRGHETKDVALVPRAGRYTLKCTHTFHKMLGMSGEIVVE